ncbi:hypothetical protein [Segatella hominis]|uniref:hypothetical protein n=1 Tax=Segatella hominis TaxID=2518605 RepID=UPI003AB97D55
MTCSTFVNPEFSITDIHSQPMNASPQIRLYFDILSKERDWQELTLHHEYEYG